MSPGWTGCQPGRPASGGAGEIAEAGTEAEAELGSRVSSAPAVAFMIAKDLVPLEALAQISGR
jgi:hypothetical protein